MTPRFPLLLMRGGLLLLTVATLALALVFFPEAVFLLSRGQEVGRGLALLACCSLFVLAAWALFQPAEKPSELFRPIAIALIGPVLYLIMIFVLP